MFPELKKLFMLNREISYLNHGSYGACPKPIFDSLIKMKKKLEFEPVRFLGYDVFPLLEKSRDSLLICPPGILNLNLRLSCFLHG